MAESKTMRPLGINLALVALIALIMGTFVYTAISGLVYLYTIVNTVGLILALAAFAGLFYMKKWGASLTAVAASFNISAQMFNFQNAYWNYTSNTPTDYITGIAIPIVAFAIATSVLMYIFKQIFANKFYPKTIQNETPKSKRTTATYLAVLINIFFISYQLGWVYLYNTISEFNSISIILAFISIAGLLSLSKWGEVITEFAAVLFLFRITIHLQWTYNYGLSNFSGAVFVGLIAMECIGIMLATVQAGYVFKRVFKNSPRNPPP
jgi:hypothetical protein